MAGVVDDEGAFSAFLMGLGPVPRQLVSTADEIVREADADVVQVLWPHQRTVGYGVGPKKLSEHYCYLDVYDEHVNLGFNHGVAVPDPAGLLKGSGARFRNLTVRQPGELRRPEVRALLVAARAQRLATLRG